MLKQYTPLKVAPNTIPPTADTLRHQKLRLPNKKQPPRGTRLARSVIIQQPNHKAHLRRIQRRVNVLAKHNRVIDVSVKPLTAQEDAINIKE